MLPRVKNTSYFLACASNDEMSYFSLPPPLLLLLEEGETRICAEGGGGKKKDVLSRLRQERGRGRRGGGRAKRGERSHTGIFFSLRESKEILNEGKLKHLEKGRKIRFRGLFVCSIGEKKLT